MMSADNSVNVSVSEGETQTESPKKWDREDKATEANFDESSSLLSVLISQRRKVALNLYDCDFNLIVQELNSVNRVVCPLHHRAFRYVRGGVRATDGFSSGRVFYEVRVTCGHLNNIQNLSNPHIFRVGWSTLNSSLQLGEDPDSYGYENSGAFISNGVSTPYGKPFSSNDKIGVFLDLENDPASVAYTINGEHQGVACEIKRSKLKGVSLFPHILTKNVQFVVNFGAHSPMTTDHNGYAFVDSISPKRRTTGPTESDLSKDPEILVVYGLPKCGKSTWIKDFCRQNPNKYWVLDFTNMIDASDLQKCTVTGHRWWWKTLLRTMLKRVAKLRINCILECNYINKLPSESILRIFKMFLRQAVVIVPPHKEYERRFEEAEEKCVLDASDILFMKGNFSLPTLGAFNVILYPELPEAEAQVLVMQYNKEGESVKEKKYKIKHEVKNERKEKLYAFKREKGFSPYKKHRNAKRLCFQSQTIMTGTNGSQAIKEEKKEVKKMGERKEEREEIF